MTHKLLSSCVVLACLLAPLAARAVEDSTATPHPGVFIKDSVITTKVKTKLAEDKMRTLVHLHVDTDDTGRVVLRGTARSQEAADNAVTITRSVEGVTSVESHIKVKHPA